MDLAKLIATLDAINATSTVVEADAKKDEKVDEEDTQESNKFAGELEKARAAGKKDFEVDGKKYQVKESEDESDDEDDKETVEETEDEDDKKDTQDLEECYSQAMGQEQPEESGMSINASTDTRTGHKSLSVTAQGQAAEQLAQLLKLSGLSGGAAAQAQPEMGMEEAYANEPNPETQSVEVQLAQGTDLNRPKTMHKHSYRQGDNPMAMAEQRELADIERRLNEELAAFKVMAEGKGKKPDFLDMDKDGDRKEPMKKALADKSKKKVSEADVVAEKAVSQQQQKFMGMVHAMQKGEKVKGASPELKKAAKSMSKADARDFAKTKHKGLPKKVKESVELTEADLQSLVKKFGMAAVTAAALSGLGNAQARPNIEDPGAYKVPVPVSTQAQSSAVQDLAKYGVKAVKDLGNDFTQVKFDNRDGVFDDHTGQMYFYSSKTHGLEKISIKDGRATSDYTSAADIGPMTKAAFQKAGIPIFSGTGINVDNKSPADGAIRPNFGSQAQLGSPNPKSATTTQ